MTARVSIDLKDAGKIEKVLVRDLKRSMNKALIVAANRAKPILWARQADAPPASLSPRSRGNANDTGTMAKAWSIITSPGDMSIMIYNPMNYAGPVETGVAASSTKIGKLGEQLIEGWLLRKGIQIPYKSGRVMSSHRAAKTIVYAMNRRKGKRLLRRSIAARARPQIKALFDRVINEARKKLIEDAASKAKR